MIIQLEDLPIILPEGSNLPKYRQIAAVIEEYLRRTNPPAGTKFFTDRMLAEHFMTTPMTVAHSLNYLAENGLLKRRAGSGTYVGKFTPTHNRRRIGIVCHEIICDDKCYVSPILSRFSAFFEMRNYECIILRGGPEVYRRMVDEYQLSGIMILVPREEFAEDLSALSRDNIPVVSIGYAMTGMPKLSFGTDHAANVKTAIQYLYDLGHRKIALYSSISQASGPVFLRSYRQEMWYRQLPVHPNWELAVSRTDEPLSIRLKELTELRESGNMPSAILIANVFDAVAIYSYAAENKLRIPEDLSLIGFDDAELARELNPPLTVIAQDVAKIAEAAAGCLLSKIENRECNECDVNDKNTVLLERGSCAAAPAAGQDKI